MYKVLKRRRFHAAVGAEPYNWSPWIKVAVCTDKAEAERIREEAEKKASAMFQWEFRVEDGVRVGQALEATLTGRR